MHIYRSSKIHTPASVAFLKTLLTASFCARISVPVFLSLASMVDTSDICTPGSDSSFYSRVDS